MSSPDHGGVSAGSPKIFMVAGEASGDVLGGALLEELRHRFPNIQASGIGGHHMQRAGFVSLYNISALSIVGIVEALYELPRVLRIFFALVARLRREKPQLLITIDLPDFNLSLAALARRLGIPVIHYVSPQVWAWRAGRVQTIARRVNHLLALYPFEPSCYAQTDLPVTFVGHPLVKKAVPRRDRATMRRLLNISSKEQLVLLLPGSRMSEIRQILPSMIESCAALLKRQSNVRYLLALADTLDTSEIQPMIQNRLSVDIRQGETYDLIAASDAALVTSGTATLETALLGTPMVVVYRVNRLTYEIGRRMIRSPFISLVNLVAGRAVVPERIQDEVCKEVLTNDLYHLLNHNNHHNNTHTMLEGFREVRAKLNSPESHPADIIENYILRTLRTENSS